MADEPAPRSIPALVDALARRLTREDARGGSDAQPGMWPCTARAWEILLDLRAEDPRTGLARGGVDQAALALRMQGMGARAAALEALSDRLAPAADGIPGTKFARPPRWGRSVLLTPASLDVVLLESCTPAAQHIPPSMRGLVA